jgi:hypothetical protein
MSARITLKAVNDELARLGSTARLAKAGGYFYFQFGEAADWLDRTVAGERVSSRTVQQWVEEFRRLKKLNEQIATTAVPKKSASTAAVPPADADKRRKKSREKARKS